MNWEVEILSMDCVSSARHLPSPNTSCQEHFNLLNAASSRPKVMDCSHRSSLNIVEGGNPTFLEN